MSKDLSAFATDLQQQVLTSASIEGDEAFLEDRFTELMIDYLVDADAIDDGAACSYRARGMQVNGYGVSEDEDCLDLFVTNYSGGTPPETVGKAEVLAGFRRAMTFVQKAMDGGLSGLEEASPVFDLALRIRAVRGSLTRVRLFYLTDGVSRAEQTDDEEIRSLHVSYHVWDIEQLHRFVSSGQKREAIEIDFAGQFGEAVACLAMPGDNPVYTTYLAFVPGPLLARLYDRFGPRLLERNVRSYLQARGSVNAGMRNTILREPHMFLAYNNGISGTAESIQIATTPDGGRAIASVKDFQIVNGGQTTASLYHAIKKDADSLAGIMVQLKLTILNDAARMDEVVPNISLYANSQNKVQTADFSANDPFHRQVEELSRTTWAPAVGGTQRQTRWFYERARGQYVDERERAGTPARKRAFEAENPTPQKFTKTDLAKFENTWNQLPHVVSRGAQKNFRELTVLLKERGGFAADQDYFERLIARAILFRSAEKLVQNCKYGGYRANIVTYTLAYLAHATEQRIDLQRIWGDQKLSPALQAAVVEISRLVYDHIVRPPGNANITEWCKKEECWKQLRLLDIQVPGQLQQELIPVGRDAVATNRSTMGPDAADQGIIEEVRRVPADTWFRISSWAKETGNLQPWQRGIAYSMGQAAARSRAPSNKQAVQAKRILEEARKLGCRMEEAAEA